MRQKPRWSLGSFSICLLLLLTLGLGVACGTEGIEFPDWTDKDVHLTVLHTSDIHSRLLPYRLTPNRTDRNLGLSSDAKSVGGMARIATVIRRERSKSDRTIHMDSGDLFQGAPIFNVFKGRAELITLSALDLDAYVIGNHDFDNGGIVLAKQISLWSSIPMLSANYIFLNDSRRQTPELLRKLAQPYTILNVQGLRIGVIGLSNTSSLTSLARGGNSLGITAMEPNETLQRYVDLIRGQVDLVTVLTHIGLTEDEHLIEGYNRLKTIEKRCDDGSSRYKTAEIKGVCDVDLIVGGHHHVVLNPPKVLLEDKEYCNKRRRDRGEPETGQREVVLIHSGAFSKFVGRLDVVIRNGEIKTHRFKAVPIDDTIPDDANMTRILEEYLLGLNRAIDTTRVFAYAPKTINRFGRATGDAELGNIVADSMRLRRRVEADFALTNSLGIRADLQAGAVSIEQFYEIFPFENSITTLMISGKEVQEMLDFVTRRSASRGCQSQAQVSGIRFVMNCGIGRAENICLVGQKGDNKKKALCKAGQKSGCYDPKTTSGPTSCEYGRPMREFSVYKLAANDYIANGGSGFEMLQRNTTQQNTGVSLRDALIEYIETQLPPCSDKGFDNLEIPKQYRSKEQQLPCIVGKEDGRILRKFGGGNRANDICE